MERLDGPRREPEGLVADKMVILLHGYGADGNDLIGLGDAMAADLPGTLFAAPNAPQKCAGNPFAYQWFPIPWLDGSSSEAMAQGFAEAQVALNAYLEEICESTGIAPERTCLLGFSQGTMMSLHVGPRRTPAFLGIVGFSGRLLAPDTLAAEVVSKPPVLLVHGDQDPVVPFESMAEAEKALTAAGLEVVTHASPGTAHGIGPDGFAEAMDFLKARFRTLD